MLSDHDPNSMTCEIAYDLYRAGWPPAEAEAGAGRLYPACAGLYRTVDVVARRYKIRQVGREHPAVKILHKMTTVIAITILAKYGRDHPEAGDASPGQSEN